MKLNETSNVEIQKSEIFKEKDFGISDEGLIFEILRNKLYSNKIESIVREISCNARDANREGGKPNEPIEIHLPNEIQPFISFKDQGIGISPDRMENIFIKYAASTKRDTNKQTGGFGLGAKTPFAYTDTFTIKTIFEGVKYTYIAYIDKSRKGKMSLAEEEKTSEKSGTEIIIPVEEKDITNFQVAVSSATQFWNSKPKLLNGNVRYENYSFYLQKEDWALSEKRNVHRYGDYEKIFFIVDEIPYEKNLSDFKRINEEIFRRGKAIAQNNFDIFLYFETGDLDLSASREAIEFTEKTTSILKEKLEDAEKEVVSEITNKIDKSKTFKEAILTFSEFSERFKTTFSLHQFYWREKKMYNIADELRFINTKKINLDYDKRIKRSFSSYITRSIRNEDKSQVILYNDLFDTINKSVANRLAKKITNKTEFLFISGIPEGRYDFLNLKDLGIKKVSDYLSPPKRKNSPSQEKFILYKHNRKNFIRIKFSDFLLDKNDKVFIPLSSRRMPSISSPELRLAISFNKEKSFYGIREPLMESKKFKEISRNSKTIKEILLDVKKEFDPDEIKTYLSNRYFYFTQTFPKNAFHSRSPFLNFVKNLSEQKELEVRLVSYIEGLKILFESELKKATAKFVLEDNINEIYDLYPLLRIVSGYSTRDVKEEDIIQYINLIDLNVLKLK